MTSTRSVRVSMAPEWAPHERTLMLFPRLNPTFDKDNLDISRRAWANVANTIAKYEPVTLITNIGDAEVAKQYVDASVEIIEMPTDDAWARDIAPTFVHDVEKGSLLAVDWVFNGWGQQSWAIWDNDAQLGRKIATSISVPVLPTSMVNEGGGIHVDGQGTVLLTETVQLDPMRNPGMSKGEAEKEVHRLLGTTKAIWLPRGLTRDYEEFGTRGHVDIIASFAKPGCVFAHSQGNPEHPDHQVTKSLIEILRNSVDAQGRKLTVIELPAPLKIKDEDGTFVDYSYVNHYIGNGFILLCAFDDPHDLVAQKILKEQFPDRVVELVDARQIFKCGGGIHCITQQVPRVREVSGASGEQDGV